MGSVLVTCIALFAYHLSVGDIEVGLDNATCNFTVGGHQEGLWQPSAHIRTAGEEASGIHKNLPDQ